MNYYRRDAETQRKPGNFLLCASVSLWFIFSGACSIPNLETAECSQAREAAKRFYSFHFANDMEHTQENLNAREQYLTARLYNSLWAASSRAGDPFTVPYNYPRAFRVGTCNVESTKKTNLQVLLLWRDDAGSEQKEISVDMVKEDDKWLLDGVSPVRPK